MSDLQRRHFVALSAVSGVLAAAAAFTPIAAQAQAYPSKPVTIIVSYPPGGDTDAIARVFAEKPGARTGQQFIVDNRPGASGTIGNAMVAKAKPDGYTLLMTPNTISTALLVLKPGTGSQYDTVNDFTPIFQIGTQPLYLVVNSDTGIKNLSDLVAQAKSGKLKSYASPGSGSPMHLLGEMFNRAAGVKLQQVPYRGSGPAITDLAGGHISAMYTTLGPVAQYIQTGKLTNIGVAEAKRSTLTPNVPTFAEGGVKGAELSAWQGFMGPKGMPADVVKTLNTHLNEIIKMPDVKDRLTTLAILPTGGQAQVLGTVHKSDHERLGKVIKELGVQAD